MLDFIKQTVIVDKKLLRFEYVRLFKITKADRSHFYRLNFNIDGLPPWRLTLFVLAYSTETTKEEIKEKLHDHKGLDVLYDK